MREDAFFETDTRTSAGSPETPEIWLTGAKGMLGKQVALELTLRKMSFIGTDSEVDITNRNVVMNFMARYRPRKIVNCAAYTAVDKAEGETETAMKINGIGPGILGEAATRRNAAVIHISTDYVFDGQSDTPYRETDKPGPVSVYGKTKLAGESALVAACDNAVIIRISWLYGVYGRNFVETMLKLMDEREEIRVVADQLGAPTYAGLLAQNIVSMIERNVEKTGIYHYQDKGKISWYGFAREIRKIALKRGILQKECRIMPVIAAEYPTVAERPEFSVLNTEKIRGELGFVIKDWKENLKQYFDERDKEIKK